jgi:hypothetical protein
MTIGAGFSSKTAWRREGLQSAYGTPAECGAGDQIPLISESLSPEITKEPDNTIRHKAGVGGSEITGKGVQGSIEIEAVYRGIESILASALGLCNYSESPVLIATGVYKHAIEPAENIHSQEWEAGDGVLPESGLQAGDQKIRRGTLCIDKGVSIWEHASTMIQALTIKGDSKGVRIVLELIPYKLDRASAVNTSSAAWTIPGDDWLSILFQDLAFWIGDYSTENALTSGNAIGISAFEVKLQNALKIERDSVSGLYIAEPRRDGKRQVTGSFSMPRYESDAFLADCASQTAKMAMLKFTGSQIGSTGYNRTAWLWLPTLKFDKVDAPIGGQGIIPVSHTFSAEVPPGAAAGFPAQATKELLLQVQNDLSTNPMIA